MKTDIALAVGRMEEALLQLENDEARKEAIAELLKNRCRKCLDYDPSGQFWCCQDSRGE